MDEVKDESRYLICPFTNEVLLVKITSKDTEVFCEKCNKYHSFQKRNKFMLGREFGVINNSWIESW